MREKPHTLYATLSDENVDYIRKIILSAKNIGHLSANKFLEQLNIQGIKTPAFMPLRTFLADVEGVNKTTYSDSAGHMTIGIGLNLDDPGAESLFYALDPKRDWQFAKMRITAGLPNPALTDAQIDQLLYLTLNGTTNVKGSFTGETVELINRFKHLNYGFLADAPFQFYQLIALQSLAFNRPDLIGKGICKTLTEIDKYGDLTSLIQIIDYSNRRHDAGLQNRRLKESAVFHGNITDPTLDIHITWRQYQRILSSATGPIRLIGGPVKWGIPKGNDQESFRGYSSITVLPTESDKYNEPIYFGTPNNDVLIYQDSGVPSSPIFFAGVGDDKIFANGSMLNSAYLDSAYLAGGLGDDLYRISSTTGTIYIYDVDRKGKILLDQNVMTQCDIQLFNYLSGPIINNKFNLCGTLGYDYNATIVEEEDGTDTLQITFNSPYTSPLNINIGNFKSGQFGILANSLKYKINKNVFVGSNTLGFTATGKLAVSPNEDNNFFVYDVKGVNTKQFSIQGFTDHSLSSQDFIGTFGDYFFASAIQSINTDSSTTSILLGSFIDGNNPNIVLQKIASHTCPSGSPDCYEFSFASPIPLTNGKVAILACLNSQRNTNLVAYINFSEKNIDTNCGGMISGYPIHNGGFLVRNDNKIILCNSDGIPYQRFSLPPNTEIFDVVPMSNGYVMYLSDYQKAYTHMYNENKGWLSDFVIETNDMPNAASPMYSLPGDHVLLVNIYGSSVVQYLIIDSNNQQFTGVFSLIDGLTKFQIGATQTNGDVYIFCFDTNTGISLYGINLTTSALSNNFFLSSQEPIDQKGFFQGGNEIASINYNNNAKNESFAPITGVWDNITKSDSTGKPIFTYRVYNEHNIEIGSAEFYAHPLLCFSEDKQRHNIIKTSGVLSELNIMDMMSVDEVCEALPPTLFDKVITSTANAAIHGGLRGGSNVVGYMLC